MTTRVTVDTHAGWPVQVLRIEYNQRGETGRTYEVVEPNTKRDFYVHSNMKIEVAEMPRE